MRGAERDIGRMRRSPRLMALKNIESRVVCQDEGNDAATSFFPADLSALPEALRPRHFSRVTGTTDLLLALKYSELTLKSQFKKLA